MTTLHEQLRSSIERLVVFTFSEDGKHIYLFKDHNNKFQLLSAPFLSSHMARATTLVKDYFGDDASMPELCGQINTNGGRRVLYRWFGGIPDIDTDQYTKIDMDNYPTELGAVHNSLARVLREGISVKVYIDMNK